MKKTGNRWIALLLLVTMLAGLLVGCTVQGEDPTTPPATAGRETVPQREPVDRPTSPQVDPPTEPSAAPPTDPSVAPPTEPTVVPPTEPTVAPPTDPPKATEPEYEALTNGKYPPIDPDVMPIGAWVAPPHENILNQGNPSFITDEQFKILSESGINLIYGLYEMANDHMPDILKTLDLCEKYGVKYLIRDNNVNEADMDIMMAALKRYASHPAFAGVKIMDEPGTTHFDIFAETHEMYKQLCPDKYYYINLLPSYANASQLQYGAATTRNDGTMDFDTYLELYIEKVKPAFLSYDYYCIGGAAGTVQQGYFRDMSKFRELSLEHDIPFWVFIQACGYGNMRTPNEAEIQWQVNTSLAYGAKGIQYFCYFTPLEDPDGFRGNFIDRNGNKTDIYYYGQRANTQIAACDEVLMHCTSKGLIVTGNSIDNTIPAKDKITSYRELVQVTAQNSGFLTGCFDHEGKSAYYVVNNSLTNQGSVTLTFEKAVNGVYVFDGVAYEFTGDSLPLEMMPGEGALVYLK